MLSSLSAGLAGMLVGGVLGVIIISILTVGKLRDVENEMISWRNMYFALLEEHGMPMEHPGYDRCAVGRHSEVHSKQARIKAGADRITK